MSSARLVAVVAAAGVAWCVPAAGQELPSTFEPRPSVATPENPIPPVVAAVQPSYPAEALASGARAEVAIRVVIDQAGGIVEAHRAGVIIEASGDELRALISGAAVPSPDERNALAEAFVRAAIDAVQRWQFEPPAVALLVFEVQFRFDPGRATTSATSGSEQRIATERAVTEASAEAERTRMLDPDWPGDTLTGGQPPLRVGGAIRPPLKIKHVTPAIPADIPESGALGVVIADILVGPDGLVAAARIVRSIPLLDQPVLDAVRQWEFEPTLLNGVPMPLVMTVTIGFSH